MDIFVMLQHQLHKSYQQHTVNKHLQLDKFHLHINHLRGFKLL